MRALYVTPNLWLVFKEECPILCHVPLIRYWAFGQFVRGYFYNKLPQPS